MRGHGPGQETLQLGKHEVQVRQVEPVGNYAVRLVFDDGHDTGLYTWDYLLRARRDPAPRSGSTTSTGCAKLGIPYPTPGCARERAGVDSATDSAGERRTPERHRQLA